MPKLLVEPKFEALVPVESAGSRYPRLTGLTLPSDVGGFSPELTIPGCAEGCCWRESWDAGETTVDEKC
ncbi:hypothetical protein BC939DRAFT_230078 [Gamsiella multidivaricata]|uniref:uncharacterized protein n=1 Tax=Gamsiella multidivaricata TaxID=101098 RepID=UPI00221F7EAF|nr:uncharacterized protein BC939DRAFT_230078 [Gamsiella multidivaricata]KAI7820506.1 hypothetical protein BC939DRAFT_230078 [Gamsiella multidivaricata]